MLHREGYMKNKKSGACLSTGDEDGVSSQLVEVECEKASTTDYWGVYENGDIVNRQSQYCVVVTNGRLEMAPCKGS